MKNFFSRMGNISKIMNRAAFSDVEQKITKYRYGSDAFMRILESRYSCHSFTCYPVSDSKLNMILDAGRLAPSAKNRQPVHIWVMKSADALSRLHNVHSCYGAPVVLIVGSKLDDAWVRGYDGLNFSRTDAAIVMAHLMLTATDAGLANMWIYDFDPAKLHEQFPEMKDYSLYGLLAIGHPDEKEGQPTELHSVRKSLEELVTTF